MIVNYSLEIFNREIEYNTTCLNIYKHTTVVSSFYFINID